eukprot:29733_1
MVKKNARKGANRSSSKPARSRKKPVIISQEPTKEPSKPLARSPKKKVAPTDENRDRNVTDVGRGRTSRSRSKKSLKLSKKRSKPVSKSPAVHKTKPTSKSPAASKKPAKVVSKSPAVRKTKTASKSPAVSKKSYKSVSKSSAASKKPVKTASKSPAPLKSRKVRNSSKSTSVPKSKSAKNSSNSSSTSKNKTASCKTPAVSVSKASKTVSTPSISPNKSLGAIKKRPAVVTSKQLSGLKKQIPPTSKSPAKRRTRVTRSKSITVNKPAVDEKTTNKSAADSSSKKKATIIRQPSPSKSSNVKKPSTDKKQLNPSGKPARGRGRPRKQSISESPSSTKQTLSDSGKSASKPLAIIEKPVINLSVSSKKPVGKQSGHSQNTKTKSPAVSQKPARSRSRKRSQSETKPPLGKKPATDKPVVQKPTTHESSTRKPVVQKPATHKSLTEKPVVQKPVVRKSSRQKQTVHKSAVEKSVPLKSAEQNTAAQKPAIQKPEVHKSLTEKPVVQKQVVRKSTRQKQTVQKSAVEKSVPLKSAEQNTAAQKPAIQKPEVHKSLTEKPVVQKQVVRKSTRQKQTVQKSAVEKSVPLKSAAQKPAVQKPAVQKPAVQKPEVHQSELEKPVVQKPVTKKPAAKKSAAQKPARCRIRKPTIIGSLSPDKTARGRSRKHSRSPTPADKSDVKSKKPKIVDKQIDKPKAVQSKLSLFFRPVKSKSEQTIPDRTRRLSVSFTNNSSAEQNDISHLKIADESKETEQEPPCDMDVEMASALEASPVSSVLRSSPVKVGPVSSVLKASPVSSTLGTGPVSSTLGTGPVSSTLETSLVVAADDTSATDLRSQPVASEGSGADLQLCLADSDELKDFEKPSEKLESNSISNESEKQRYLDLPMSDLRDHVAYILERDHITQNLWAAWLKLSPSTSRKFLLGKDCFEESQLERIAAWCFKLDLKLRQHLLKDNKELPAPFFDQIISKMRIKGVRELFPNWLKMCAPICDRPKVEKELFKRGFFEGYSVVVPVEESLRKPHSRSKSSKRRHSADFDLRPAKRSREETLKTIDLLQKKLEAVRVKGPAPESRTDREVLCFLAQRFLKKDKISRELTKKSMRIGWDRAKKLVDKFLEHPHKYVEMLIDSMEVSSDLEPECVPPDEFSIGSYMTAPSSSSGESSQEPAQSGSTRSGSKLNGFGASSCSAQGPLSSLYSSPQSATSSSEPIIIKRHVNFKSPRKRSLKPTSAKSRPRQQPSGAGSKKRSGSRTASGSRTSQKVASSGSRTSQKAASSGSHTGQKAASSGSHTSQKVASSGSRTRSEGRFLGLTYRSEGRFLTLRNRVRRSLPRARVPVRRPLPRAHVPVSSHVPGNV